MTKKFIIAEALDSEDFIIGQIVRLEDGPHGDEIITIEDGDGFTYRVSDRSYTIRDY